MKQYLKNTLILAAGLLVFQLVESIVVYQSNTHLVRVMEAALKEGFLAVPNALVLPRLQGLGMALAGGLFYTLTVGALVTLVSLFASRLMRALPVDNRVKIPLFLVFFILILVWVNLDGILIFETLALSLTTGVVVVLDHLLFNRESAKASFRTAGFHLIPPVILAIILFFFFKGADDRIFSDFRDTFLLNNPVGMAINDFYYQYTLAPAEVFKTQNQKQIKTAVIRSDAPDSPMTAKMKRKLHAMDYLLIAMDDEPDLTLDIHGDTLSLSNRGRVIMETPVRQFLSESRSVLSEFSRKTDRYNSYRVLTRLGLLTGFPLLMYLILHCAFFLPAAVVLDGAKPSAVASGICFVLGLTAFGTLFMMSPVTMNTDSIASGLSSPDLPTRLSALRLIHDEKRNIKHYPGSAAAYESPHVVERYWAARASAFSRDQETYDRLIRLLNDANLNVQTQACYSLGQSGKRRAIAPIYACITTSGHWYVQFYAYRALKRLGWTQNNTSNP